MRERRRITSIKPGRAPSFMGGIGSVVVIIVGIFWTLLTFQMTRNSPFGGIVAIFPLFGVLFIVIGIINAVYSFRQATQKNRYSLLDITDSASEPDPLNQRFDTARHEDATHVEPKEHVGESERDQSERKDRPHRFCPYCGDDIGEGYRFCPSCGKELPE